MIVGVLLRALGWPLQLVFTSAAQRHHTWITRWLIRRMDAIIATNEISASFLKREATVIPHGVDTDTYAPPADRAAAFAEAKLPGRYAIGCFGRVRAQKGTDVFVDAMCRLLPRYPDFTAVIVGAIVPEQIAFASDLKKRIEAAGLPSRIVMTGELPIEEVQRWYQRLTIYAFTSRNEGFGLTLIEAMSAGAALVASRAGAAELVVENGVTGVLTPPGDVDALVAALEPLLRDPAVVHGDGNAGADAGTGEIQSRCGSRPDRGSLSRSCCFVARFSLSMPLAAATTTPSLRAQRGNPSDRKERMDCFDALAMTARYVSAFPRRDTPELCLNNPPKEGVALPRGSGECRVPVAPAAARVVVVSTRVSHHGRTGITRHSRTRWF